MMIERNERNNRELCVTCSDPSERNERNTTLGSVTVVRWGAWQAEMVPMPRFLSGPVTGGMTFLSTHTGGLADG